MAKAIILSVNAGSSSIKCSVYERQSVDSFQLITTASIAGLTSLPPKFQYTLYGPSASSSTEIETSKASQIDASDHSEAFRHFIDFLSYGKGRNPPKQVLDLARISVVCHRIVHGGLEPNPLIITDHELHHLDELSDLAPLYGLHLRLLRMIDTIIMRC